MLEFHRVGIVIGYRLSCLGLKPSRDNRLFFSTKYPYRLWGPYTLLFKEYRGSWFLPVGRAKRA